MNAKELMLGDWVYNDDSPAIVRTLAEGRINGVSEGLFNPIPLTEGLLKSHGFTWTGSGDSTLMYGTTYGFPGIRYIFYVGLKKKTIEAHVAFPELDKPGRRKSNKVWLQESECYLHNLQHAMRLVGVEINISPYFCDE